MEDLRIYFIREHSYGVAVEQSQIMVEVFVI
jgi:hypothetical protein